MNEWIKWISRQLSTRLHSLAECLQRLVLANETSLCSPKISCNYVQLRLPFLPDNNSALMAVFLAGRPSALNIFLFLFLLFSFVILFIFLIFVVNCYCFCCFPLFWGFDYYFWLFYYCFLIFDLFRGHFGVCSSVGWLSRLDVVVCQ